MPNKVVIIDTGYIAFRSILSFSKQMSMPIGWLYFRSVVALLKRCEPDYETLIILAKDSPRGSWRRDVVPEYKANRKEKRLKQGDEDFWHEAFREIDIINKKINDSFCSHLICIDKIEADDLASVACRYYSDKPVLLCSSDSDWEQLLNYSNVKLMGVMKDKSWKEVKNPIKILNDKIMKGDVADNLLGKPQNDLELEKRRKVVSLLQLPDDVEKKVREQFDNLPIKSIYWSKIPFRSIKNDLYFLYEGKKVVN